MKHCVIAQSGTIVPLALTLSTALTLMTGSATASSIASPISLDELCRLGHTVFRGTVLSAVDDTVRAGGGRVPIIVYRIKVDESFKGQFREIKGVRYIDVRMLRTDAIGGDNARTHRRIMKVPRLEVGASYVLMMARPSAIGMSAPIGLEQGLFRIAGHGPAERVTSRSHGRAASSLTYRDFAQRIRQAVERSRRPR